MASLRKKWGAKDPQKFTHLLLDGGKLFVPDQQHSLFLNEYSNCVARSEKLFVVETRTPTFRLFVDFDFKPVPAPDIITAAIQSACGVAAYYFDTTSRAVVLRKDVDNPEKVGVHLTWDAVFVTSTTALSFRNHLVAKLEKACDTVDWRDVVDSSVYTGSGLRLPWSSKVNAPGVYFPQHTCTVDGTMTPVQPPATASEIRDWIKWTSIRAPDAVLTRTCVVTSDDPVEHKAQKDGTVVHESVRDHAATLEKIHATLPEAYATQKFTSMHRFGDFCVVLRSDSRRCGNKAYQPHTANTVYFVVLRKGYAYQRCYCRKDVVREGGVACADYVSDSWTIPKDAIDALWPPVPETTSKLMDLLSRTRPALKKKKLKE
jgi:hypothetical protein